MAGFITGPNQIITNKHSVLYSTIANGKEKYNGTLNDAKARLIYRSYSTGRLTNSQRESFIVTPQLHEIIIGVSLGDLFIRKVPKGKNAFLIFEQGLINEGYILHLYDLFKDYCTSAPKKYDRLPDKRTDKVYSRIQFYTYSLPCFNYYHSLFYVNGVKIIPKNIGELLTPVSLAYWGLDDGAKSRNKIYLNTDSYSLSEVQLLIKVLKENFNLNCSYHLKRKDQYRFYIKKDSMDKFRSLVTPHFHESLRYKLTVYSD
jgi:LAGLIDADG DNA endonuclease family